MNLAELEKKLIAVARAIPANDRVPYAFEQRVLARLRRSSVDLGVDWATALWRAAGPCLGIAAVLGVLTWSGGSSGGFSANPEPDLESSLYAVVDTPGGSW